MDQVAVPRAQRADDGDAAAQFARVAAVGFPEAPERGARVHEGRRVLPRRLRDHVERVAANGHAGARRDRRETLAVELERPGPGHEIAGHQNEHEREEHRAGADERHLPAKRKTRDPAAQGFDRHGAGAGNYGIVILVTAAREPPTTSRATDRGVTLEPFESHTPGTSFDG